MSSERAAGSTSHELVEEAFELGLRVRAPSFGELVAEAGRAISQLMLAGPAGPAGPAGGAGDATGEWRRFEIHATDRAAVLVNWLNEIIFHAETEHWIPTEFTVESASDSALEISARGVTVEEAPTLLKAATFHGLEITETDGTLLVEIILDI